MTKMYLQCFECSSQISIFGEASSSFLSRQTLKERQLERCSKRTDICNGGKT